MVLTLLNTPTDLFITSDLDLSAFAK